MLLTSSSVVRTMFLSSINLHYCVNVNRIELSRVDVTGKCKRITTETKRAQLFLPPELVSLCDCHAHSNIYIHQVSPVQCALKSSHLPCPVEAWLCDSSTSPVGHTASADHQGAAHRLYVLCGCSTDSGLVTDTSPTRSCHGPRPGAVPLNGLLSPCIWRRTAKGGSTAQCLDGGKCRLGVQRS